MNTQKDVSIQPDIIHENIFVIRGKKVMFDKDLAMLYGVSTKILKQAVKRNIDRFPEDFMFKLTKSEADLFSRSQFVTLKKGQGHNTKYEPFVFTEQGIAMLSSVLKSKKAIHMNIQIIRIFIKIREMINPYKELEAKVKELEKDTELNFKEVFKIIRLLIQKENKKEGVVGFDIKK
jgi:hypothetical protein